MSWAVHSAPSFNITRPGSSYQQLSGFSQRFMLTQDSRLLTPGTKEKVLPAETMTGTYKRKRKGKAAIKRKPVPNKHLIMPNYNKKPERIIVKPELKQPKLSKGKRRVT